MREMRESSELEEYLHDARQFKVRRLAGLSAICVMLLASLVVIYANGWWTLTGTKKIGAAWVFVGIAVVVCTLGAVLIDLLYRQEL